MDTTVVDAQMQVLNEDFAATPFLFYLMGTKYVVNDEYYLNMTNADYTVGTLYKAGGPESLMAYFGSKTRGGSWSRFPELFNTGKLNPANCPFTILGNCITVAKFLPVAKSLNL